MGEQKKSVRVEVYREFPEDDMAKAVQIHFPQRLTRNEWEDYRTALTDLDVVSTVTHMGGPYPFISAYPEDQGDKKFINQVVKAAKQLFNVTETTGVK